MNYVEKIKRKLRKTGGVITGKDLREENIPTIYLTRMVETGDLIRVERGIYIDSTGDFDEYYFFHKRYQSAVFSYLSALYLHQFIDIIPQEMEITVCRGYNIHRMGKSVRAHYVAKSIHGLGATELPTIYGNKVRVYDLERTLCDIIKDREELESEMFAKTINKYVRSKEKDLSKLYEYSREMKIYDKVREILEVVYE
ncbi:abortive phage infection protein [Clostridiales bacterium COT073_COT-073]|nr:abortive phage infection protein [Clostridiales bacterium COT073_COT-073]